jgi:broad specificity phosphatase PhoE
VGQTAQATLRVVYSYFMDIDRELVPRQSIPLHTVIKITFDGWMNCTEERFQLGPDVPQVEQHEGNAPAST